VPGLDARRVQTLVSHLDLAPTLLALCGLPVPDSYAGRSLVPAMEGGLLAPRPVLAETIWKGLHLTALRTGAWKRIEDRVAGTVELYDLKLDAAEHADVSAVHPERAEQLARLAQTLLDPLPGFDAAEAFGAGHPQMEARLQDLGYVDD
jgi:arylsulfatase A-like enzyme